MNLLQRGLLALGSAITRAAAIGNGGPGAGQSWENPDVPMTLENLASYYGNTENVTHKRAMQYAPLFQAVGMISGDCAKLPFNVYGRTKLGRAVMDKHNVQAIIHRTGMPNPELNGYKFWRRFYISVALWGNGYAWVDRNNRGDVIGLYQLLPDRTWKERRNGVLYCATQTIQGTKYLLDSDVIHVEGLCIDGLQGLDIVSQFRRDFLVALSSQDFWVKFYKNNMSAGGILQAKPGTKDSAIRKMEKRIAENFSGSDKAFKTLVMRDNFQWFKTQITPHDAEATESIEQTARQVARMYNIPASRLMLKDSVSYNSEEAAKQNYFDGALSHVLIGTSSECTVKLLSEKERSQGIYCEHNINALLWADAQTRSEIANNGILSGRFSPNETREWENMDGYEGGDTFFVPMNVQPVTAKRAKRQQQRRLRSLRTLAEQAFTRAINRASIKLERNKPLDEDREGIVEIVQSTMVHVGHAIGRDCSNVGHEWFDAIASADPTSFRAHADASVNTILDKLFTTKAS